MPNCRLTLDTSGRIQSIASSTESAKDGFFALPGMPNAHSHAFQRAMAGFGEQKRGQDSFWSWRDSMYRVANNMMPDDLTVVASRAYDDMLLAGFTSVAEFHYLHHWPDGKPTFAMAEAILEAAQSSGIRLLFLPVLYQRGGFETDSQPLQKRFVHKKVDDYLQLIQRLKHVATGIAPHSLRAVDAATLSTVLEGAEDILGSDFPIHIHISEQTREVEDCLRVHARTPIWFLSDSVSLDGRWNLIHATHATRDELTLVQSMGANIVLCPLTEAYLGDGIFDAVSFFSLGGQPAIGSDSNARIDAMSELRWLEYGQRLKHQGRAQLGDQDGVGARLWLAAVAGGAKSLGLPVAGIAEGQYADLVVLDPDHPTLQGTAPANLMDAWLVAGDRTAIHSVYVAGHKKVQQGELLRPAPRATEFAATVTRLHQ